MTTRVHGSFRRVEQTASFFSVEVVAGFDEEVTYKTEAELDARREELRDKALQQMLDDLALVKKKLGVEEKRVFVKDNRPPAPAHVLGVDLD